MAPPFSPRDLHVRMDIMMISLVPNRNIGVYRCPLAVTQTRPGVPCSIKHLQSSSHGLLLGASDSHQLVGELDLKVIYVGSDGNVRSENQLSNSLLHRA